MKVTKIDNPKDRLDDIRALLQTSDDVVITLSRGGVIKATWAEVVERRSNLVHTLRFGSIQTFNKSDTFDGIRLSRMGGYLAEYLSDIDSLEFVTY
jgi:hypothetical protein